MNCRNDVSRMNPKTCMMSPTICKKILTTCMKILKICAILPNANGCSNDVNCGVRHRLRRLCPCADPPYIAAKTAYSKGILS